MPLELKKPCNKFRSKAFFVRSHGRSRCHSERAQKKGAQTCRDQKNSSSSQKFSTQAIFMNAS